MSLDFGLNGVQMDQHLTGMLKDSYASGDVTQTFNLRDMSGIGIRNTSWKDLVTFYDVEFKRHPAKNSRYINSLSSQDSTNNTRSAFNIQTKENKKSVISLI